MSKKANGKIKPEKKREKPSRKKVLIIIVCILVAIILIFGITLGTVVAIKNARAVVMYEGVRLGDGECNFLISYYKYSFLTRYSSRNAADTEEFWNSKYDGETTFGELLKKNTEEYIREVVVAAYLFDSYCEFTNMDKIYVEKAIKGVLDFKANGSEEEFDALTLEYGFDYEDFESVCYILYKAQNVMARIYGEDGSNMQSFPAECNEYFETYSHVKLLFIRTDDKFMVDEDGNRVRDDDGNDVLVALSDAEKAERAEIIAKAESAIKAYEDKSGDFRMTPEYFNTLIKSYDEGEPYMRNTGYYFSPESSYTLEFAEANADVVKRSLEMEIGSYSKVNYDGGVCFIYKYANSDGAYMDTSKGGCFEDFYALAAQNSFYSALYELLPEVKVKDKYYDIDLTRIPYNYVFIPRF